MANDDAPELVDVITASGVLEPTAAPWPAIVQSYDAAKGLVTAQPTPGLRDYINGKKIARRPVEVPIAWFGCQGVTVDAELVPGDEVVIVPCAPSIAAWLLQGGITDGQRPGGTLGEGFAIPVRLSAPRRPGSSGGLLRMGRDDGTATITATINGAPEIKVTAPSVELGAGVQLPVARDTDPVTIAAAYATFVGQVTTFINGLAPGTITPVASTTVGTVKASSTEVSSS